MRIRNIPNGLKVLRLMRLDFAGDVKTPLDVGVERVVVVFLNDIRVGATTADAGGNFAVSINGKAADPYRLVMRGAAGENDAVYAGVQGVQNNRYI